MTEIVTYISEAYKRVSIAHPDFWFGSRGDFSRLDTVLYLVFSGILLAILLYFLSKRDSVKDNPFKRSFFARKTWIVLFFLFAAVLLGLFHYQKFPLISARAMWLPFFFALVYFAYFSFIDYSRKIPEKTARYQSELMRKKYLRPFRKKR